MMVQTSPRVRRWFPSTMSWEPMFSKCTFCSFKNCRALSTFSRQCIRMRPLVGFGCQGTGDTKAWDHGPPPSSFPPISPGPCFTHLPQPLPQEDGDGPRVGPKFTEPRLRLQRSWGQIKIPKGINCSQSGWEKKCFQWDYCSCLHEAMFPFNPHSKASQNDTVL